MAGIFSALIALGLSIHFEEYGVLIGVIALFLVGGILHGMVQRYIIVGMDDNDPLYEATRNARTKMTWGLRALSAYCIYLYFNDGHKPELIAYLKELVI